MVTDRSHRILQIDMGQKWMVRAGSTMLRAEPFWGDGMKVLIVDDSAKILRSLTRALSGLEDVEVVGKARNVVQALQLADEVKPDVVVLEIGLREGSGFDVLRHIRQAGMSTKVILIANSPVEQHRKRGEREGADHVFDKSSEFDKVVQAVERFALNE